MGQPRASKTPVRSPQRANPRARFACFHFQDPEKVLSSYAATWASALEAFRGAKPNVIVHQMIAVAGLTHVKHFDRAFAATTDRAF